MINIKGCVMNDAKVHFEYYRDSALWYQTVQGDIFPVPIDDIGNATFKRKDKASLFMRYMRKWNQEVGK